MSGRLRLALAVSLWLVPAVAAAHPAPFSYLDVRVSPGRLGLTVTAHVFDLAHELGADPATLLDPSFAATHSREIADILSRRLTVALGTRALRLAEWPRPELLADRQSWRWSVDAAMAGPPGRLSIEAELFPYDSQHQTFVNVYEGDALTSQYILNHGHRALDHYTGTRAGVFAVLGRFVPAGIQHILIGPDHLLFLIGLLIVGGTMRRLALIVSAFTVAHSVTLSMAVLNLLTPSARLIEPAIALSIVYVGLDNLTSRGGRDLRVWIALAFGLIHGFGFAGVLREMNLPSQALGWSLLGFNAGVELGQMAVVAAVAVTVAAVRTRSAIAGRRLAFAGSLVVVAAGAFWFLERVFFTGGVS